MTQSLQCCGRATVPGSPGGSARAAELGAPPKGGGSKRGCWGGTAGRDSAGCWDRGCHKVPGRLDCDPQPCGTELCPSCHVEGLGLPQGIPDVTNTVWSQQPVRRHRAPQDCPSSCRRTRSTNSKRARCGEHRDPRARGEKTLGRVRAGSVPGDRCQGSSRGGGTSAGGGKSLVPGSGGVSAARSRGIRYRGGGISAAQSRCWAGTRCRRFPGFAALPAPGFAALRAPRSPRSLLPVRPGPAPLGGSGHMRSGRAPGYKGRRGGAGRARAEPSGAEPSRAASGEYDPGRPRSWFRSRLRSRFRSRLRSRFRSRSRFQSQSRNRSRSRSCSGSQSRSRSRSRSQSWSRSPSRSQSRL